MILMAGALVVALWVADGHPVAFFVLYFLVAILGVGSLVKWWEDR